MCFDTNSLDFRIANAALIIGALGLTIIVALSLIGARVLALNTGLLAVQAVLIVSTLNGHLRLWLTSCV